MKRMLTKFCSCGVGGAEGGAVVCNAVAAVLKELFCPIIPSIKFLRCEYLADRPLPAVYCWRGNRWFHTIRVWGQLGLGGESLIDSILVTTAFPC